MTDADRSWDEKGSAAYKEAAENGQKTPLSSSTDKTPLIDGGAVKIPEDKLRDAFPFPAAFLMGWSLFGISYFLPIDGSTGFIETITWDVLAAAVVSLALGYIASIPMADAVMTRNASKKQVLSVLFLTSWIVLTVVSGWGQLSKVQALFRTLGMVCIIASMKVLWKYRKMGDTWESEGKPNPNPVVYNIGGPLFVFGWFLFWFGMAATSDSSTSGLPLYFTWRSALAFLTGAGMVPVVMFVDYAHDEGAEYTGWGTDGTYFGTLEQPQWFIGAWTLFGFASLLPFEGSVSTLQWIILANCILQGIVAGILIQSALYKGDMAGKTRWSIPFVLLFLALAFELGHSNKCRLTLSLTGAIFIIAGQKTVFGNRKRGDYWMETGEVNPNPIVYSVGEPLFMTGWLMMSLVMAMPL